MSWLDNQPLRALCGSNLLAGTSLIDQLSQVHGAVRGEAALKARGVGDDLLHKQIHPGTCSECRSGMRLILDKTADSATSRGKA